MIRRTIILATLGILAAGCGDGSRAAEAPELVSAGRSITDRMVQRLYREWVFAVANRVRPDY